ncbi:MAG TPA: heparinase II/III family protein [Polyangiaceae bacterium]|nr:MAG: Heparin-sulfate lyase precursor [Deltaproteobacteria bacterium ADurb.Bin207]HNZ22398.1 heparinase II/III family protein [Polyangiaceae bacterium]HOD20933.1 heparinase II/III family protein [Polyangiaceae bacterium]HOE48291.1 heparinase II/III family protein [Polyangiaceae bacterium]HOH00067.1 heparinase II/III family protein [Polyangiaceae bacterium]
MKTKRLLISTTAGFAALTATAVARADTVVDDFENFSGWTGLVAETKEVHDGKGAGRWQDHVNHSTAKKVFATPLDVSGEKHFQMWVYSAVANNAKITLVFDSENAADHEGWDYYSKSIYIDWTGWRFIRIPLDSFGVSRNPLGWNHINYISLHAGGWGTDPKDDTLLILDSLSFGTGVISSVKMRPSWKGNDFEYRFEVGLEERLGKSRNLSFSLDYPSSYPFSSSLDSSSLTLSPHGSGTLLAQVTVPSSAISGTTLLDIHSAFMVVSEQGLPIDGVQLDGAVPLVERDPPRTLLDAQDFARIEAWSASEAWASNARASILNQAEGWPEAYEKKYFLSTWALPPEGGQWSLWYVCPVHGVNLKYEDKHHRCPVDGQEFTGWPYDQVIYGRMHGDLAKYATDLGLAWRMTGQARYCQSALEILEAYADVYDSYPIHDIHQKQAGSGARVLAQTLDEAGWLLPMAWAYDMVANCPAMTSGLKDHIEQDLLRHAVAVIQRHPAGESNWQSWHNAALGAVGFAIQDPVLIAQAIRSPTDGFAYQMKTSVTADGFWYEGSWGYHFFALDPLMQLARMATKGGYDLLSDAALQSMFRAPIRFAMPDWTLPPFNDSGSADLISNDRFFEMAWQVYQDPIYLEVLGKRTRGRYALYWGEKDLPQSVTSPLSSELFPDAGYAVLRSGKGAEATYIALDYGPHGGWHGHYDKLGFVLYANGATMAVDPGTQSYAAPTHATWDKVTVAHNTVVVDTKSQQEATGNLHRFLGLPGLSIAAADAGNVYGKPSEPTVDLLRTMVLAPEYLVDRFHVQSSDGSSHDIDWILHSPGEIATDLAQKAYDKFPKEHGYQHLSKAKSTETSETWRVAFEQKPSASNIGSVWGSETSVKASFSSSKEQAHEGSWSGKMTYDFQANTGYGLYAMPTLEPVQDKPDTLRFWVYGDGSKHGFGVRVNDATDERFVKKLGSIDWKGWKSFEVSEVESWSHYLGNNDGVLDTPVKNVSFELTYQAGGASAGAIWVDDVHVSFDGGSPEQVTDFEVPYRALRVQMLADPSTTVVTGEGLGPNLLVPVPFVMARRHGQDTTFLSLLEPGAEQPRIKDFAALPTDAAPEDEALAYRASTDDFIDTALVLAKGKAGTERTFGDASCDGSSCLIRTKGNELLRLVVGEATALTQGLPLLVSEAPLPGLQVDYVSENQGMDITAQVQFVTVLRVLGPQVTSVRVNGQDTPFQRDGDYVVLNLEPSEEKPDAGSEPSEDADVSENQDGATDAKENEKGKTDASDGNDDGCGCRVVGAPARGGVGGMLALLGLWGVVLRRRYR